MIKHKKQKYIFYVPGMISLVMLPLLCLGYFYKNESFKEYRAINIGMPSERSFEEAENKYKISHRNYKQFVLNSSEALEKGKLKEIQLSLRLLKRFNDTVNGVKIHLGKRTSYAVFIRMINMLGIEEEMPTWGLYKNDIWVLMPNKYKKEKAIKAENHRMNCGTQDIMWAQALRLREIEKEKEKQQYLTSFFEAKWPIFLGYLGILLLNIFALVKLNKNRKYNQKSYI